MSLHDNPMGEPPLGGGRRPVAHYLGLAAAVIALVVVIAAIAR